MLDRTAGPPASARGEAEGRSAGRAYLSYSEIVLFVRRYAWTMAAVVAATMLLAGLYLATARPVFTARAQLLIDPRLPMIVREQLGDPNIPLDSPQVESQLAVLRSEDIALTVIDKLDLDARSEFSSNEPLGPLLHLRALLSRALSGGSPPASAEDVERTAIAAFLARLDVRRVGMSYAIDISFRSFDPELAAAVANAIAEAYLADQLATRARAVRQGSEWLEERIEKLRRHMNDAALMVQEFKAKRDYRILSKRDKEGEAPASPRDPEKPDPSTLEELESKALAYRKIYESLVQTYAQTVQLQSFPVANARIISKAMPPRTKSQPRVLLVLGFGLMAGTVAGFWIALLRHNLDRTVRTPVQIREVVGVECLGQLPRLDEPRLLPAWFDRGNAAGQLPPAHIARLTEVRDAPFSRFTDGMKRVKTAISLTIKAQPIRCVGLTSAFPKEGKSTVAANLAGIFAGTGQRVLLIDADVHNATLSRSFCPQAKSGLIEVLTGEAPAGQCIVHCHGTLDLLPTVTTKRLAHANDLLSSQAMRSLLRDLLDTYDFAIVDLPPVRPVVDALAVGSLLDAMILVSEWGATTVGTVAETARALATARATLLGVVITKVAPNAIDEYGARSAGNYY